MTQTDLDHLISEIDKIITLQALLLLREERTHNSIGVRRHRHIANGLMLARRAVQEAFLSDGTPIINDYIEKYSAEIRRQTEECSTVNTQT